MLTSLLTRIVRLATARPWHVILLAALVTAASCVYVVRNFAINTDIGRLLDSDAPWALREEAIAKAFPQRGQMILAVVQAPAAELADAAADALAAALRRQRARFTAVSQPGGGAFFARNGLLFAGTDEVRQLTQQLTQARPLLNALAHDPTLRGLSDVLATTLALPLQMGQVKLGDMAGLLGSSARTLDQVLARKPAALSWAGLLDDSLKPGADGHVYRYVALSPVLDYSDLKAGAEAARAIRHAADELQLAQRFQASVRLTGPQALADDEFASVSDGALLNGVLTVLAVVLILWLALRSARLIVAVLASLFAGLLITAALGLAMVGALNMISVAFAVLFVGLGVDFGIQFGVRYRAERHDRDHIVDALGLAARAVGAPLALAAAATAAAFFCFLPTDYRGVAELGLIAGVGMMVAFATTFTLLPALIAVLRPGGESASPGFAWLAPADRFFDRYRKPVLLITLLAILAGAPLLPHLRFDFDPLHLKDPQSESMATLLALQDAPQAGTDDVNVLAPSLPAAHALAGQLAALPEVARAVTLQSFIPDDQPPKLQAIGQASAALMPALAQPSAAPATDSARVDALRQAARQLAIAADQHPGPGAAEAARLSATLEKLAAADAPARDRAERAIALPLQLALARLKLALTPQAVSQQTLPPELVRDWIAPDGRALVNVSPRLPPPASAQREAALARFIAAVQRVAPAATGGPISIRGSADTIMTAFAQAGAWAVLSITLLLWITLRRFGDVLRTLIPLLVSAIVTLELCVVFGIALNFANVIALPLLLGVGVAFKIYYVIAWRHGKTQLLQSSLTHAVLYSAATTAVAFGSLWLSQHPGTASMGKLLALALACTLVGAVFFQPILMGRPRDDGHEGGHHRPDQPARP
ncbi:MMPL family transporter [Cupriavidus taiwanensis]|uniref:hopanoid transporter HpnN n=1 Tax=Cupriavidus taiwanensis TaxID=164546 RepID=UPI000E19F87B|nr:MMPL family transporter [Cupriavidus taiwanensis]SPA48578.1 putative transporter, exporter RND family [Cupriavidus taiwanensis]